MTDVVGRAPGNASIELRQESVKRALDLGLCLIALIACGPLLLILCGLMQVDLAGTRAVPAGTPRP